MRKIFIRAVFSTWSRSVLTLIINFFLTPFIVHSLGNASYGIWALFMSLGGYYSFLNLGLRSATMKYVSEFSAKGDNVTLNKIINSSLAVYIILGFICFLISCIISVFFFDIFKASISDKNSVQIAAILAGLTVATGLFFNVFSAILKAYKRFDIVNNIIAIFSIVRLLFVAVLLWFGFKLVALSLVWFLTNFAENLIFMYYSFRVCKPLKLKLKYASLKTFRKIFNFSLFTFLANISDKILRYADTTLIGIFLNTGLITYYAISESLIEHSTIISKGIWQIIIPFASESDALKDHNKIRKLIIDITRISLLINSFIAIIFFFLGRYFIDIWMGKGYELTYIILCILIVPRLVMDSLNIIRMTLIGIGRVKFIGAISIIEFIINPLLSLILLKFYGIKGIAYASLITMLVTRGFVLPIYTCKIHEIPMSNFLLKTIIPILYVIVPCTLMIYIIISYIDPSTYIRLFLVALTSSTLFAILSYYLCCDADMKSYVNQLFQNFYLKIKPKLETN